MIGSMSWWFTTLILFWTFNTTTAKCKLKRYTHKAVQTDLNDRKCWDHVSIMTCYGFCSSYEIADWQFPYKVSHHPVCLYSERRHASHKLRHCDPNVEPGTELYHYVEAASCRCQTCSSEDTSCDWLTPDFPFLEEMLMKEEEQKFEEEDEKSHLNLFLHDSITNSI